jgi:hypothetical protein
MLHMPCQMLEMHKGKLYICYKGAPIHQLRKSNKHQDPPRKRVKVTWSTGLVKISTSWSSVGTWIQSIFHFSPIVSQKMIPHFYVLGFGMKNLVLCYTYGTVVVTLMWDMGILLTKVSHGVCDPKELRATTRCGKVLCLGSGLSSTRLHAGRPRHQRRSQELARHRSGLPIQPTHNKIRVWKTMKHQTRRRGVPKAEVGSVTQIPEYALDCLPMLENERTDIPRTGCPASSPSSRGVTRSRFGTPSGPHVHPPHPHQEL